MWKALVTFIKDEQGLTVVEYVISSALLVVVLSGVFAVLQDELVATFTSAFN
ncbi:Flp family type IVb pilin [Vibrio sonorensis]|uniref:Flp family type IVb pilin n=1 Tax=Vibrio sonorensis TaxID=1004316 RepID=UPI0015862BC2|nr:hypothetical protein [Vibrio sonorensis]